MKRLLVLLCIAAFLAALPLSHVVMAAPAEKINVCHVNSANDVYPWPNGLGETVSGRVISVSADALDAHLAHGDSTTYFDMDEDYRDFVEEFYGISLPNANCFFWVWY